MLPGLSRFLQPWWKDPSYIPSKSGFHQALAGGNLRVHLTIGEDPLCDFTTEHVSTVT